MQFKGYHMIAIYIINLTILLLVLPNCLAKNIWFQDLTLYCAVTFIDGEIHKTVHMPQNKGCELMSVYQVKFVSKPCFIVDK
jgi:hypothetical protein